MPVKSHAHPTKMLDYRIYCTELPFSLIMVQNAVYDQGITHFTFKDKIDKFVLILIDLFLLYNRNSKPVFSTQNIKLGYLPQSVVIFIIDSYVQLVYS